MPATEPAEGAGTIRCDVAIIGGGPGGSTAGALLKKYAPGLDVVIVEREEFPREHVGESQLPEISKILDEMGVWDRIEAADFPIKIGATYRWGASPELWDFEFIPLAEFHDEPRPAKFEGQRTRTAFQVDRAIYDDILLNFAAELGCRVVQPMGVAAVDRDPADPDCVAGLRMADGRRVEARYYIDASGHAAVLRRALGVPTDCPTQLKNIAIWDYWENADWAVEIGVGGTRVQVMSLGYGWIWFIPLGPTRTSIGLVCPAEYAKRSGKPPEQLYAEAVAAESRIARLTEGATRTGKVRSVNDWSFRAERTCGANWFLVGECAGFADPILAAGLTLTHVGARECAYTIVELERGRHDSSWLKHHFDGNQRRRVGQHIRFADFWYAANGQFTDLQEHCRSIARESGLELNAREAWAWLAQGGFTNDVVGQAVVGGFDLGSMKHVVGMFVDEEIAWNASQNNVFTLDLEGATEESLPVYEGGEVKPITCYVRDGRRLPVTGMYGLMVGLLRRSSDVEAVVRELIGVLKARFAPSHAKIALRQAIQALEGSSARGG